MKDSTYYKTQRYAGRFVAIDISCVIFLVFALFPFSWMFITSKGGYGDLRSRRLSPFLEQSRARAEPLYTALRAVRISALDGQQFDGGRGDHSHLPDHRRDGGL